MAVSLGKLNGKLLQASHPPGEGLDRRLVEKETIQRRLKDAREEISHAVEFDYVIINKEFEEARRDLAAVVRASRVTLAEQSARHPEIFKPAG